MTVSERKQLTYALICAIATAALFMLTGWRATGAQEALRVALTAIVGVAVAGLWIFAFAWGVSKHLSGEWRG